MPKYLLTNEVIAAERWKMLVTNPAYSEDLTSKQSPGKSAVCTYFRVLPGVDNATAGDFPNIFLAKSGWRTENFLNGSFAAGNWTFRVRFESTTKYGFSIKVACRLSASTQPSGVGETASYGGVIYTIWGDDTHIYVGGITTQTVRKYLKSDLSYIGETASYGGTIYTIWGDATHIYVGGATTQTVRKYLKSDLSNVVRLIGIYESPNVIAIPASAGGSVTDTWSANPGAITFTNEYLFAEYRIHIEVAGTNAAAECAFACDEDPAVADESIQTTAFISAYYKDIATRFLVTVQSFKDISTRYRLTVQSWGDIVTRFIIHAQGFKDIPSRFKLFAQGYRDISTRFRLGLPYYKDTATRFLLTVQSFKDISTRFKLTILAYKDIASRFKLTAQNYKDITTRFRLGLPYYKDVATRFKLEVRAWIDIATRFKLTVQNYRDIATRFKLTIQGFRDAVTRFRLWAQAYKDIATRFKLWVRGYQDIVTRFLLWATSYKDVATRFRLSQRSYADIATRFYLRPAAAFPIFGGSHIIQQEGD